MTLLSGGGLQAEKVRKPKGRLGASRSLSSPYTSCSHNALAASHTFFCCAEPEGKKVSKLLFLTLNPNQLLLSDTGILWSWADWVNTSTELPPESSMQRIFPKSQRIGKGRLTLHFLPTKPIDGWRRWLRNMRWQRTHLDTSAQEAAGLHMLLFVRTASVFADLTTPNWDLHSLCILPLVCHVIER